MGHASKPHKYRDGWRIKWIDENRSRKSSVHCTFVEAATALIQRKHEVEQVIQGLAYRIDGDRRFSELADYWLEKVAPTKRSYRDIVSIIQTHLRPYFGAFKLSDINQEYTQDYFLKKETTLSRKTISNHLTVLISMLNFSKDMKWLREVPKIRRPKISRNGTAYSYLRNDQELKKFLESAKAEGVLYFTFYATAVFTGLRAGELAGLRWEDIDLVNRRICVQRSFNNPTKNENIRFVPILDTLLLILKDWEKSKLGDLVFTTTSGTMIGESARIFQESFKKVLTRAEFPMKNQNGKKQKYYIRFHDLRHSFASHWMMKGGDIYRLQKIMGHQSIEMTQRYSHLSPHIYREDYGRFNSISL